MIQPGSEPARARRALSSAVLAVRWFVFAWFLLGNLTASETFTRPGLAWATIGIAGAWTAFLTVVPFRDRKRIRTGDMAVSVFVILMSGVVVADGSVLGQRLFFAATYPLGTALAWGTAGGPLGGVLASVIMGIAVMFSRPLNGVPLGQLPTGQIGDIVNGVVSYLLAGFAGGVTAVVLDRWELEQRALVDATLRANARAARLAERDSIARQIHDSVLQALAMVHKRGRELGARESVPGRDVQELAEMAGRQERDLRALILREPEEPPTGTASLREALEQAAGAIASVPVTVSAVGPIWMPAHDVTQLAAAVAQALNNVEEHARASKAVVFAETENGWVTIAVRDDGVGFVYDESQLRQNSKAGLLKSIKGRVEALGGHAVVESSPGRGTEVELRVPQKT